MDFQSPGEERLGSSTPMMVVVRIRISGECVERSLINQDSPFSRRHCFLHRVNLPLLSNPHPPAWVIVFIGRGESCPLDELYG